MQSADDLPHGGHEKRRIGASRAGRPNRQTKALRDKILRSLEMAGGEKYLAWCAKTHAPEFLHLLGRLLPRNVIPDSEPVKFVVQQLVVQATPIPGVSNSPISGHIAAPCLGANRGEVIEAG